MQPQAKMPTISKGIRAWIGITKIEEKNMFIRLSFVLLLIQCLFSLEMHSYISKLNINTMDCKKINDEFKCVASNRQEFDFKLSIKETSDDRRNGIFISFKYILNGREFEEILFAPITVGEDDFRLTDAPYSPSQKLDSYLADIKSKSYYKPKNMVWNGDENSCLALGTGFWCPVVSLEENNKIIFHEWEIVDDKENHLSKIYVNYSLANDAASRKMSIYEYYHDATVEKYDEEIFFIENSRFRDVKTVKYQDSVKNKKWRFNNNIVPLESYVTREIGTPHPWKMLDEQTLSSGEGEYSIKVKQPLDSRYIYVNGENRFFRCTLSDCEFSSASHSYEAVLLRPTDNELALSKYGTLTPVSGFNINAFYKLKCSMVEPVLTQIWEDLDTKAEVTYKSDYCSTTFVTKTLSEHKGLSSCAIKECLLELPNYDGAIEPLMAMLKHSKDSLIELNLSSNISALSRDAKKGNYVGKLIGYIKNLTNLEKLNIRSDGILCDNIYNNQTVELSQMLISLTKLKHVNVTLPYASSHFFDLWARVFKGEVALVSGLISSLWVPKQDFEGKLISSAVLTLQHLAAIPHLESLTLGVLGTFNDLEEIKKIFNGARASAGLKPVDLTLEELL